MRQIFLAGEEAQERTTLLRRVIANCSLEHRVAFFERIQNRSLRDRTFDWNLNLVADVRQRAKMLGKLDSNRDCHSIHLHFTYVSCRYWFFQSLPERTHTSPKTLFALVVSPPDFPSYCAMYVTSAAFGPSGFTVKSLSV